jgi:uncharacterized protein (DUF433 family)
MRAVKHREVNSKEVSIFDAPSYKASEAAFLLKLSSSTVRAWCFGQQYKDRRGASHSFQPVIAPADREARLMSFSNLCELHVLGAITRGHRIPLQRVRRALEYVRLKMDEPRPLLAKDFVTNGLDLFLERAGQLISVSQGGQTALRGEFERRLNRIERGSSGNPVRLFPFTRTSASASHQPTVVVIDPSIAFGRPIVALAGVRTEVIRDRFSAGDSPADMAKDYGVSSDQILEAIRYEQHLAA